MKARDQCAAAPLSRVKCVGRRHLYSLLETAELNGLDPRPTCARCSRTLPSTRSTASKSCCRGLSRPCLPCGARPEASATTAATRSDHVRRHRVAGGARDDACSRARRTSFAALVHATRRRMPLRSLLAATRRDGQDLASAVSRCDSFSATQRAAPYSGGHPAARAQPYIAGITTVSIT